jgi:multiple sugar transport system ATP-binding protein
MTRPLLSVAGLKKHFGGRCALADVSFDVREGEILALLGPTGAGKTTTIRTIAGLEAPDAGSVHIDGCDITASSPLDRDLAVVFEGFNLLPVLSVYDNIAFPLRSPRYRESEETIRERVDKAAADLRIVKLLARKIDQLSGGERQRVAIARALVRRPTLYMLDEPLSALDLKLRESLAAELRDMHRRDGASILYATHDYNGAASLGNRIALIEAGRILQVGALAELIAAPSHAGVGRLIGSPAMSFFTARSTGEMLSIPGLPWRCRLDRPAGPERDCLVGAWPEDLAVSPVPVAGYARGEVYATDYRGLDQAIEVRCGPHRLRKVLPLDAVIGQGDACWFALPQDRLFVFDGQTGERVTCSAMELEACS